MEETLNSLKKKQVVQQGVDGMFQKALEKEKQASDTNYFEITEKYHHLQKSYYRSPYGLQISDWDI